MKKHAVLGKKTKPDLQNVIFRASILSFLFPEHYGFLFSRKFMNGTRWCLFKLLLFLTFWCNCFLSGAIASRSQTSALVSLGSKVFGCLSKGLHDFHGVACFVILVVRFSPYWQQWWVLPRQGLPFSTKHAYNLLTPEEGNFFLANVDLIWAIKLHQRKKIFAWFLFCNRLNSKANLSHVDILRLQVSIVGVITNSSMLPTFSSHALLP